MARTGVKLDGVPVSRAELQRLLKRGGGRSLRQLKTGGTAAPKKRVRRPPTPDPPGTFDAWPPSAITITGRPVCLLTFDRVPSLNDYDQAARSNPYAGDTFAKRWQTTAHCAVETWAQAEQLPQVYATRADGTPGLRLLQPALSRTRAGLVWRIYSRTRQKADRPLNLTIKPLCDGLTHAGFWPDDDDKHVPLTLHIYEGVDRSRPRIELEIHALPAAAAPPPAPARCRRRSARPDKRLGTHGKTQPRDTGGRFAPGK